MTHAHVWRKSENLEETTGMTVRLSGTLGFQKSKHKHDRAWVKQTVRHVQNKNSCYKLFELFGL